MNGLNRWMFCAFAVFASGMCCGLEIAGDSGHSAMCRAGMELREYAKKMGVASDTAKFTFTVDPKMKQEEWSIVSVPGGVRLSGGSPRGVQYALWHYLEDVCGVRWWSPREESVPKLNSLPVNGLRLSGIPAFEYRGIFSLYARDKGRFASRMRMNDDHNSLERLSPEYGGSLFFGPPGFVHTLGRYVPESRFSDHPEWFSLIDGKRLKGKGTGSDSSQRCFSNQELRVEMKKKLREYIQKGEADAAKHGIPKPLFYNISQNDGSRFCECAECMKIVKHEGALSGIILDFINELARDIAKDYPDIRLVTLAYNKTETPPKHIRPEKNVVICLAAMKNNAVFPLDEKNNSEFYRMLTGWAARNANLMIWDYNINYRNYNELAYPSEFSYPSNLKLYRRNGVRYTFAEFESPNYSDVREYKIWLWLKLIENPDQDFEKLSREFAEGYYGKAGKLFLDYRNLLKKSVERTRPYIAFTPTPDDYLHLDLATMTEAMKLFDAGEKLLADDPVRLMRWKEAKLSLNRSALFRSRILKREYLAKHGTLEGYPIANDRLFRELREVWKHRLPLRPLSQSETAAKAQLENDIARYGREYTPGSLKIPEKFSGEAPEQVFDLTMENSSRFRDFAEIVKDPESAAGFAARLAFPNRSPELTLEKHRLPLVFGVYSVKRGGTILKSFVTAEKVPGPGYHWYRFGKTKLSEDAYVFCFPSWMIQQPVGGAYDHKFPEAEYDVWISMKLTGRCRPSKLEEGGKPDAIWIDRIVLVRKTQGAQ